MTKGVEKTVHPLDHDGDGKIGGKLPGGASVHDEALRIAVDNVTDTIVKDMAALKAELDGTKAELGKARSTIGELRREMAGLRRQNAQLKESRGRVLVAKSVDDLPTLDDLNR